MKQYMKPQVESPSLEYAEILLQDYAGVTSELTAANLYIYQHFLEINKHPEIASQLEEIAIDEMRHLDLLGQTIKLLGVNPEYGVINCSDGKKTMWTAANVNYTDKLKEMLIFDIQSELLAIRAYEAHKAIIDDKYIKRLLSEIIADEEEHVKTFRGIYAKIIGA